MVSFIHLFPKCRSWGSVFVSIKILAFPDTGVIFQGLSLQKMTVRLKYSSTAGARGLFIVTTRGEVMVKLKIEDNFQPENQCSLQARQVFYVSADTGRVEKVSSIMGLRTLWRLGWELAVWCQSCQNASLVFSSHGLQQYQ